jgi:subtilisin family serine protease
VGNNCRVAPAELPGVLTVSATGPIGYPDYDLWIADYSSVGMSRVDVAAPGGDYFRATGTAQDAVLGAVPGDGVLWATFDPLNANFPGITVIQGGGHYIYLNGTSMSSPHAAGVAALVKQQYPNWSPGAVKAAVQRSAQHVDCPPDWQPLGPADERERCYGNGGRTSFFGHGLVDAAGAAATTQVSAADDAALLGADASEPAQQGSLLFIPAMIR